MIKSIVLGSIFVMLLSGCGNDDNNTIANNGVTVTPPPATSPVAGGGVKGPLANAVADIYQLDPAAPDLKGVRLGSGRTGANASLQGLTVPSGTQGLLLLEISADADTTDITTGAAPMLTRLQTVVEAGNLNASIYATPITSLAVSLAEANADSNRAPYTGNADGTSSLDEIQAALNVAAGQVVSSFGFGLPATTNIFSARPLLTDADASPESQQSVLAYRQSIEAVSAVIALLVENATANNPSSSLTPDQVLLAVAADLSDGAIDGQDVNGPLGMLADVSDVALIATTDASLLKIPGTDRLVSSVSAVLAAEVETTGATVSVAAIAAGDIVAALMPVRINTDADGDGVADRLDAFPNDPSESVDSDKDSIGDNADTDDDGDGVFDVDDAFPLDATESLDTDMDGIGNNTDTDDDGDGVLDIDDALPLDKTESIDTDGDGQGNNIDEDDDGDGVLDVLDAFPLDGAEATDTDSDGTGNNADTDDDGDSILDVDDALPLDSRSSVGTTQLITTEGGSITSPDQKLTLTIPAGALSTDTSITIGQYADTAFTAAFGPGESINGAYIFEPDGLVFNTPASASFQVDPGSTNVDRTKLPFSISGGLVAFENGVTYQRATGVITAPVNHFSVIGYSDGTLSVRIPQVIDGEVGEEIIVDYSVVYDASNPNRIVLGDVIPEGFSNGVFTIQPKIEGDEGIIANAMHVKAGAFPVGIDGSLDTSPAQGSISVSCVKTGTQSFSFNLLYSDVVYNNDFGDISEPASGTFAVDVRVTCAEPSPEITEPIFFPIGSGVDRINSTFTGPYNSINCSDPLYTVVSDNQTVLTNASGTCQKVIPASPGSLGAVLISDPGGERLLRHSLSGTSITPLIDGALTQLFGGFFNIKPTTDASYSRNSDGSIDPTKAIAINKGIVYEYSVVDGVNQETEVFNSAVLTPGKQFISYRRTSTTAGVGVTSGEPSEAYQVDEAAATADLIGPVGNGALNVQCAVGLPACTVSSRGSERIFVMVTDESGHYEITSTLDNISTASPSVTPRGNGDFVVASVNDTDGRVNVSVFNGETGIAIDQFQTEFFLSQLQIPNLSLQASIGISIILAPPDVQLPNGGLIIGADTDGPDVDGTDTEGLIVFPFEQSTNIVYFFK